MIRRTTAAIALAASVFAALGEPAFAQVESQSLNSLDLFSTGAANTGLPNDLWRGTSTPLLREVLPTIGAKPLTPAAAALARRVLSTPATAPEGAGNDADLAGARVRTLIALGDLTDAIAILDRTPNLSASSSLSQAAAEAALIAGDDEKACRIGDGITNDRGGIYWVRLRAFCQVRTGDLDAAQLTFTVANQQKDAVYTRLMGAALGGGAPGAASLRNGLDYALSRRLNLPLEPAMATASPALVAGLAASAPPPPPPAGDLTAGETAALTALRAAKGLTAFTDAAQDAAPNIAALARAHAPLQDAALFIRAAVAAGDIESAQAIRADMKGDTIGGPSPTDIALLDGLIAAAAGRVDEQALDRLVERGRVDGAKSQAQPAALILAALGGAMGPQARAEFAGLATPRGAALPSRLAALDLAAEGGLKGETALLALTVADVGAAGPPPADRARIVQALRRAGLGADARAFAAEGLLLLQIK